MDRSTKITFGVLRHKAVGTVVYCADYRCSHSTVMSAEPWADDIRLSDSQCQFTCTVCGKRGADVRPDFGSQQNKSPA